MRAIDRLCAAVDLTPARRSVELPDGSEFEFWVSPLTAAERERAMKEAKDDAQKFGITLLINKARDENGAPLFASGDYARLKRELPTKVLDALSLAVLGTDDDAEDDEEQEEPATDMKSNRARAKA